MSFSLRWTEVDATAGVEWLERSAVTFIKEWKKKN